MILSATRKELIEDLPADFAACLPLSLMTDTELTTAWKRHGLHRMSWVGALDAVKIIGGGL